MDEPVTDIKFVSSADHCPEGYNIITKCPCGHDAQLWEKVIGGESGKRYLCFAKDKKVCGTTYKYLGESQCIPMLPVMPCDKDTVIEDLYIPSKSEQYLRRGYIIIKETEEGNAPMYHRQLAIKTVPRSEAKKVVVDIIVARAKDKISTIYKKTEKVNGLCICYRTMDYTYTLPPALAARRSTLAAGERVQKRFEQVLDYGSGTADSGRDLGKKFEGMRVYDEKQTVRPRAGSDVTAKSRQFKVNLDTYAPSPPESPGVLDSDPLPPYTEKVDPQTLGHDVYKVNLTDYNPSPIFTEKPVSRIETDSTHFGMTGMPPKYSETPPTAPPTNTYVGEVAAAAVSYSLGSAPPPPASSQAPPTSSQAPPTQSSPYPPPTATTTAGATTFNPNPVSYQPSSSTIQSYPPPPLQQQYQSYPPAAPPAGGGYPPYTAVQSGAYQPQPSRYPPSTAPATTAGPGGVAAPPPSYNPNIGFQVGGVMGGASYLPPPQPGYQYQSVGANPFGQSGFSSVSGGPAPYNPFHHQPAGGGVGAYPPPPSQQGTQQNQSASSGYGFKF